MKHIMVPIDGSEPAYRALEFATKLAKGMDAELSVLIVREFIVSINGVSVVLDFDEIAGIKNKVHEMMMSLQAADLKILVEESRDAAYTIVDVAIEKQADLIVMGASGRSGIKKVLLGSVSQEVLRKSACPVTIVH